MIRQNQRWGGAEDSNTSNGGRGASTSKAIGAFTLARFLAWSEDITIDSLVARLCIVIYRISYRDLECTTKGRRAPVLAARLSGSNFHVQLQ